MSSIDTEVHEKEKNRRSLIVFILIFLIIGIVIIVIVPLEVVKGRKPQQILPPNPPTPPPILPNWYNQYYATKIDNQQDYYHGFLASNDYDAVKHSYALSSILNSINGFKSNDDEDSNQNSHYYTLDSIKIPTGENNKHIKNVSFYFAMPFYPAAYLKMTDAENPRFNIPLDSVRTLPINPEMRLEMLGLQVFGDPFSFSFTDVTNHSNVFVHTNKSSLVFMDKFIQMDFQFSSQRIFGFGERMHEFMLSEGTWQMWARNPEILKNGSQRYSEYDDGSGGKQGFGVHPLIMVQGKTKGDYFGMFFRNSNAQSPLLKFNSDGSSTLSYITTGGELEVFFLIHGSPKVLVNFYHTLMGNPSLPPFWALGWHQTSGRGEGIDQNSLMSIVEWYDTNQIPLETLWIDNPYMDNFQSFSVNSQTFPDIKNYIEMLHEYNKFVIVVIEGGLSADNDTNQYYQDALNDNILIQSTINEGALMMKTYSNKTVFIDWYNRKAGKVLTSGLSDLYKLIPFDGLWLDMNEPSGFCNGECAQEVNQQNFQAKELIQSLLEQIESTKRRNLNKSSIQNKLKEVIGNDTTWYYSFQDQSQISTYYLPFIAGYQNSGNLDTFAISLNATYPSNQESEYNLHSLYGHMMSKNVKDFLTKSSTRQYPNTDKRPFIMSSSTFVSSGHFSSHIVQTMEPSYQSMKYAIASIMSMNLFGIPMTGADICGRTQTIDEELCARQIQFATLLPFSRFTQDPSLQLTDYNWKNVAKDSIYFRYSLLRHIYSCLFQVSLFGGTCIDPTFYLYGKQDENTFNDVESSFILGDAILVTPILEEIGTSNTYEAYFPGVKGRWINIGNISNQIVNSDGSGRKHLLPVMNTINAFLKPQSIVAFQNNSLHIYNSTSDLINASITILINANTTDIAEGVLFLDQGELISEIDNEQFEFYKLSFTGHTLNKFLDKGIKGSQPGYLLESIMIFTDFNQSEAEQSNNLACAINEEFQIVKNLEVTYNLDLMYVQIKPSVGESLSLSDFDIIIYGDEYQNSPCNSKAYVHYFPDANRPNLTGSETTFTLVNGIQKVQQILQVQMKMVSPTVANINWKLQENDQQTDNNFEVPKTVINPQYSNLPSSLSNMILIENGEDENNGVRITIQSVQGTPLITINEFLYDDHENIICHRIHSDSSEFSGIFGLGERVLTDFILKDGVYSLWNREVASPVDEGLKPGGNMYGSHPFYMFKSQNQLWVGVFTNVAAAQDWYLKSNQIDEIDQYSYTSLKMVALGGIADLYFIVGISPIEVVNNYWDYIIGRPVLIPQYTLGWHQCRWGYANTDELYSVVKGYQDYNIPLDTQWSDIDYMENYRDFTYDHIRYSDLPEFIDYIHGLNITFVPIIDAAIAMRPWGNYDAYDEAYNKNLLIKVNKNDTLIGMVWPNQAAYPDWLNVETTVWWQKYLDILYQDLPFDGLWLDMNEASDFCSNFCDNNKLQLSDEDEHIGIKKYKNYLGQTGRDLNTKSISIHAWHPSTGDYQIDTHSLFGTLEVKATNEFLTQTLKKRAFILSRSSFAGLGKYGSKWLGDNFSQIEYLQYSITGSMLMNIFGIPLVGADICGFAGVPGAELCARWTVVGAFYPFSRNHNYFISVPQEPYTFDDKFYEEEISYTSIMRSGIRNKYHLIKYYYTQFFLMSTSAPPTSQQSVFFMPLFFQFPDDPQAYQNTTSNIMLGSALKLGVLTNKLDVNNTDFYFPAGIWCDIFKPQNKCYNVSEGGEIMNLPSKAYDFYVHLYQGNIIPMQNATQYNINNTKQLQNIPVDFHIVGNDFSHSSGGNLMLSGTFKWYAQGAYVNDDGETLEVIGNHNHYAIAAMSLVSEPSTIIIQFQLLVEAFNYQGSLGEEGCSAVNTNDYLNNLFFYEARTFGIDSNNYQVTITYRNGTVSEQQNAVIYDSETDRLIYKGRDIPQCMTIIDKITLKLLN